MVVVIKPFKNGYAIFEHETNKSLSKRPLNLETTKKQMQHIYLHEFSKPKSHPDEFKRIKHILYDKLKGGNKEHDLLTNSLALNTYKCLGYGFTD